MSAVEETKVDPEEVTASALEAIRKQIEYYFSKDNLPTDTYLQQNMDAQKSVPISIVMKFAKLKALTTDESVVRRALADSSAVTIVDNRIKANIKPSTRSTIILRDIPEGTPEDEVRAIFDYEGGKKIANLHPDIGNTWFVTFETEDDAVTTLFDLRSKKRTFKGQSVKARMKTEQVVRSYFPVSAGPVLPPPLPFQLSGFPPTLPPEMLINYMVAPLVDPASGNLILPTGFPTIESDGVGALEEGVEGEGAANEDGSKRSKLDANKNGTTGRSANASNKGGNASGAGGVRGGGGAATAGGSSNHKNGGGRNRGGNAASNNVSNSNNARNSQKGGQEGSTGSSSTTKPPVEINAVNFPPLFNDDANNTPVPVPGYQGEYLKYTIDDVIAIVKTNVTDATLPSDVNAAEHSLAMQSETNLDLLKRQRTFTIDETREQLRQGRPVTSGLLFGAVDTQSLHYGDDLLLNNNNQHHYHALHTIEEKNEALNNSVDALNASALELSISDIQLTTTSAAGAPAGSDSFAEPSPSTNAAAGSVSPARMSMSSWAAMIKSSADATAAGNNHVPAPFPARVGSTGTSSTPAASASTTTPTVAAAAPVAKANEKKTEKKGDKKNTPSSSAAAGNDKKSKDKKEGGKKSDAGNKDSKKQSNTKANEATTDAAASSQPVAVTTSTDSETKVEESANSPSGGAAWGGKSSFASVLKQKAADDDAGMPSPVKAAPPGTVTATLSRRQPKDSSKTPAAAAAGASTTTNSSAATASSNTTSNSNNNSSSNSAASFQRRDRSGSGSHFRRSGDAAGKGTINESAGMWARETLPPLNKNA